jgi:hypothetical protein
LQDFNNSTGLGLLRAPRLSTEITQEAAPLRSHSEEVRSGSRRGLRVTAEEVQRALPSVSMGVIPKQNKSIIRAAVLCQWCLFMCRLAFMSLLPGHASGQLLR